MLTWNARLASSHQMEVKSKRGRPTGETIAEGKALRLEAKFAFSSGVRTIDRAAWRRRKHEIPGRIAAKDLAVKVGVCVSAVHKWRKSERYLSALDVVLLLLWLEFADQTEAASRPKAKKLVPFSLQGVRHARQRDRESAITKGQLTNDYVSMDGKAHQSPDAYYSHVRRLNEDCADDGSVRKPRPRGNLLIDARSPVEFERDIAEAVHQRADFIRSLGQGAMWTRPIAESQWPTD